MTADQGGEPPGAAGPAGGHRRPLNRRVYYVAGFDPASPKKYHRIYGEQAARQGAITGVSYEIGELLPVDEVTSGWTVRAIHPDGRVVEVDYRFLHWFEGVREAWPKDNPALFLGFFRALRDYHRSGLLERTRTDARVAWYASLAASTPPTAIRATTTSTRARIRPAAATLAAREAYQATRASVRVRSRSPLR